MPCGSIIWQDSLKLIQRGIAAQRRPVSIPSSSHCSAFRDFTYTGCSSKVSHLDDNCRTCALWAFTRSLYATSLSRTTNTLWLKSVRRILQDNKGAAQTYQGSRWNHDRYLSWTTVHRTCFIAMSSMQCAPVKHDGKAVFEDFLPNALKAGTFTSTPSPLVVGKGLESIQAAVDGIMKGVSAQKLVVTLDWQKLDHDCLHLWYAHVFSRNLMHHAA